MSTTLSSARLRDAGFLDFARRHRRRLFVAAYLLHGAAEPAERVTQLAMAEAYHHRAHYLTAATERLLRTDPDLVRLPWLRSPQVELLEPSGPGPAQRTTSTRSTVLARLAVLPPDQRAAVVAATCLGLPAAQAAEFLGSAPEAVSAAMTLGLLSLSDVLPAGVGDPAAVLEAAVPAGREVEAAALEDLAHGRWLVNRRRLRRLGLVAAVVAAVVLIGAVVWPDPVTVVHVDAPAPTPSVSTAPSASTGSCADLTKPECRVQLVRDWRSQMAGILADDLDPKGAYFSGYSYGYTPEYDSDRLWRDRHGALGLDMFRSRNGGTSVFLQIATSRKDAIACGKLTKRTCVRRQMMDFNYFSMTTTTSSRQGVEIQYCPEGTQVITLVARDVTKGERLDVTSAQLLQLIQDPRLRLPKI